MSLKVGVISDIHMRNSYREEISEELRETVEYLEEFEPDLVVALGDVIQQEETEEEDRRNIEQVKGMLDFDCDVRYMAGNHDSENLSNDELEEVFGNELYGVEEYGDEKLIFLNTSSPWLSGSRGEVTEEQIDMLEEEVQADEEFTVFTHHPIHYHNVQDNIWWENYPERAFCNNKKEINRVLEPENVKAVINGHLHENDLTEYEGTEHVTLNAFSKETPDKPVTGTYAEVEIGEGVEVRVYEGEELVRSYGF